MKTYQPLGRAYRGSKAEPVEAVAHFRGASANVTLAGRRKTSNRASRPSQDATTHAETTGFGHLPLASGRPPTTSWTDIYTPADLLVATADTFRTLLARLARPSTGDPGLADDALPGSMTLTDWIRGLIPTMEDPFFGIIAGISRYGRLVHTAVIGGAEPATLGPGSIIRPGAGSDAAIASEDAQPGQGSRPGRGLSMHRASIAPPLRAARL